jgi:hypothetical protein
MAAAAMTSPQAWRRERAIAARRLTLKAIGHRLIRAYNHRTWALRKHRANRQVHGPLSRIGL